jgi:hypothetical protein
MSDDGNVWTGIVIAAVLAGSVYYCNKEDEPAIDYQAPEQNYSEAEAADSAISDVPPEPSTAPVPEPNYDEKDGANYYYVGALTEEERKSGKTTGYVFSFQYGGKDDSGAHIVFSAGQRYTCSVPCKIIKASNGTLTQYSENSIIGVVFQDAMRGFLKAPPKPKAQPINEDPWIDYNNAPLASESSGSSLNTPMNSAEAPLDGNADKVQ